MGGTSLLDCPEKLLRSAAILNAMANAKRLEILLLLCQDEWGVGELAKRVGLSNSALSQHLAKLRAAQLVSKRKLHHSAFYCCMSHDVRGILSALDEHTVMARHAAQRSRLARQKQSVFTPRAKREAE